MEAPIVAEFISKFHSISGITVGERQKNLFLLLNHTKQSLQSSKINISMLQPKTPLEENFKIDTLIYFRQVQELLQVLQGGYPIFADKVLNAGSWFIQQAFGSMSGEELMTQVFPSLSYNSKLKLLNKLSLHLKDASKADEYFSAVKETYGMFLASKLLPACSKDLIIECIETHKIEITPRQLLHIIKKYPSSTEYIFDKLHKFNYKLKVGVKYKYVFTYLAHTDPTLFIKLYEKYNPEIKLGSRATKTIIVKEKEHIVEKPKQYYSFLKEKRIGANLKKEFDEVYLKLFPSSITILGEHINYHLDILKYLPSDAEKLQLLLRTFKAKYGSELWDYPTLPVSTLVKMMPSDEREIWMQTHSRPSDLSEDEWISLMKPEKSIPILKEKISFTSNIKERAKLVGLLVGTCNINKDTSALLDICQYILQKHRNDHLLVKQEFLSVLHTSTNLMKLSSEHWKHINEFITLWKAKHGPFWRCSSIVLKYIQYCFENNLPVKDQLTEWAKHYPVYNIFTENPEYEKKCLIMFKETFPSVYKKDDLEDRYISYLEALRDWNKRHPRDKFSLFINGDAIEFLKSRLEKEKYAFSEERLANSCVIDEFEKCKSSNLLEVLLKRNDSYYITIYTWLLKKQPLFFCDHIELIAEKGLRKFSYFLCNFCRYYTHLELPQRLTDMCLNILQSDHHDEFRAAAKLLSITMNSKEFLSLPALDSSNDVIVNEEQTEYQVQQAILQYVRLASPPSLALETVLKFTHGDYMNLIQKSLYSVAHDVPEKELVPFFKVLRQRAVSVRKHAIFLGFRVLNKADTYAILSDFVKSEKNPSIHKSLFKGIFNFFMRNPDEYSWNLTKNSVKLLDANDKEAFSILTKCRRISPTYFQRYILFTWNVLEEFQKPNEVIEEGKCRILDSLSADNISSVPSEFCERIIKKYFLKSEDLSNIELKTHSFVCTYITYASGSVQQNLMKLIFDALKIYVASTWHDLNNTTVARRTVSNFVKKFCSNFENRSLKQETLNMFMTLWNDTLKPSDAFCEYLHLQFTLMYTESINNKLSVLQIGEKLAALVNFLDEKGLMVTNLFCDSFKLFKTQFLSINDEVDAEENEIIMIQGIVESNQSPVCLILAISLLPYDIFLGPGIKEKYNAILETLVNEKDSLVQIHLHHYLVNKL